MTKQDRVKMGLDPEKPGQEVLMKIVAPDTGWFCVPFYIMTFRKVDPELRGAITPPLSPEYSKVESTATAPTLGWRVEIEKEDVYIWGQISFPGVPSLAGAFPCQILP